MSESLAEFERRQHEVNDLRDANIRLATQLRDAKDRIERLVDAAHQGSYDAMTALGPIKPVPKPLAVKSTTGGLEVALWHMTDFQLGKRTTTYNSEVARQRALYFVDKAIHITKTHRATRPVEEVVIAFGGDMIEGVSFQFPTQPFEIDSTIFEQYATTSRLLVDIVRQALAVYSKVTVVSEWGNHGRMGSKRDAVPRADNVDRMVYFVAREILGGESRLTWEDSPEDIQRIEIGNYRALLIHGDEIGRGGYASPSSILRHADRWRSGAYPWDFTDVLVGHYHQHQAWGMANGRGHVYMTGSLESDNRYAMETMAAAAVPSQRLHFIDPERGRTTAEYQIYVVD